MKLRCAQIVILVTCFVGLAGRSESTEPRAMIIQADLGTGITRYSVQNNSSGMQRAMLPLSTAGSEFQLWAEDFAESPEWHFLDQKLVGAYQPSAEITIVSFDPNPVLRTRADMPFAYRIRVWGLSDDLEVQSSARVVNFARMGRNYSTDTYSGDGYEEYEIESEDLTNTDFTDNEAYSELRVFIDPRDRNGEERFVIASYPDEDVDSYSILANEKIEVWPVANSYFEGFEDGAQYMGELPTIRVTYERSYPKSTTYVQIYPGPPVPGTLGRAIPGSVRVHDAAVPQNDIVTLTQDKLEPLIGKDGVYTMEVVTITPFYGGAPEIIATRSLEINRDVEIRGQVITSE